MNILPFDKDIPLVNQGDQPIVLRTDIIITKELKLKLDKLQAGSGIHVSQLGKMIVEMGFAQVALMLRDEDETKRIEAILKGQATQ